MRDPDTAVRDWAFRKTTWLVEGFIPENEIVLILGKPHNGKSWITEQMAVCVSAGVPYLQDMSVKKRQVIVVDEDSSNDVLARRMSQLARGIGKNIEELPITIHSMEGFLLTKSSDRKDLIQEISAYDNPLVLIDSLGKVTASSDLNRTSEAMKVSYLWNEIRDAGCTLVIVHHMSLKHDSLIFESDATPAALGNTMLIAGCDTAVCVFRPTTNSEFVIKPQERRTKLLVPSLFSVGLYEGGRGSTSWVRLNLFEESPKLPSDKAKLIFPLFMDMQKNLNPRNQDGLTVKQISEKMQGALSEPDIREALKELELEKALHRGVEAHNRYKWVVNDDFLSKAHTTSPYWDELISIC